MNTNNKKALIAMSGGVDSAVAALLLKKEGYDVGGITMKLWSDTEKVRDEEITAPDENITEAKKIADILGIPHYSLALGDCFHRCVIDRFISDYAEGKTPNPCVECNKHLKFGKLFEETFKRGYDLLATGHYARIEQDENGRYLLKKAVDEGKDQSYFLWSIDKSLLGKILFPLGSYTKPEIRAIAAENNFTNAHRSDSQDICFIPDGDYISFIGKNTDLTFPKGDFVDTAGNILGRHEGIIRYTIGQRKGLGIAVGYPIFVGKKDAENNTVTLCSDRELYSTELFATDVNLLSYDKIENGTRLLAKIRYRHTPAPATVSMTSDGRLHVVFDEPQRAICSGQSVVLYNGDIVVGGGIIA
jgi:tRNA-specific 2-thiouridylase